MDSRRFDNGLVSVITPAYNAEKHIVETIESVLCQTMTNWEMLIVNDFSCDGTRSIINKYIELDKRIKLIDLQANLGVAEARNNAIKAASGRYLAFLDSDDLWLPNKLQKQLAFMKEKNAHFSFTQYRHFDVNKDDHSKIIDVDKEISYSQLLKGNTIGCLTVMIDRKNIPDIVMPSARHEDYITWLSILKKGTIAYGLKEDLARYRKDKASLSGNKKRSALWTWQVFRNYEKLPFFKALYYYAFYILKGIRKHRRL